ncbi:hypothetical protein M2158_005325 [Streptomyces sp. SAI-144]|nr:hypothetical protein [Streptomyces sp. SAI-144]MDH6436784.1 hypothetical protein [Streptomyces sp. SAI-144]
MLDTGADGPDHPGLIDPDQAPSALTELREIVLRRQVEALR